MIAACCRFLCALWGHFLDHSERRWVCLCSLGAGSAPGSGAEARNAPGGAGSSLEHLCWWCSRQRVVHLWREGRRWPPWNVKSLLAVNLLVAAQITAASGVWLGEQRVEYESPREIISSNPTAEWTVTAETIAVGINVSVRAAVSTVVRPIEEGIC